MHAINFCSQVAVAAAEEYEIVMNKINIESINALVLIFIFKRNCSFCTFNSFACVHSVDRRLYVQKILAPSKVIHLMFYGFEVE